MPATAVRLRNSLERYAERVCEEWADDLTEAVRADAPVAARTGDPRQRPSGTLQRRIKRSPVQRLGSGYRFKLEAPGIEALTTAEGARAHVIRPRKAGGVLMFYKGGGPVFARQVNHPGNAASDWWAKSLRQHAAPTLRAAGRRVRL